MTDADPGIEGGCRCGATRYTLAIDRFPKAYACHCLDCQSWSGSAFSQQLLVAEEAVEITGPVVDYRFTSPSGSTSHQRLCGVCHARIFNTNDARPGVAVVRAGTLDRSNKLETPVHIWVRRKQRWFALPEGAMAFEEGGAVEAMTALFVGRGL